MTAARKAGRVTQIGTQQRSGEHFQKAVELVQAGKLGRVSLTRTWNFDNEAPKGIGKAPEEAVPKGVDYDRWLGPAPARPFTKNRFHYQFRWFFDYAAGMIGDWNVHLQDIVHWGMNVTGPRSVSAVGGTYLDIGNPLAGRPDLMQGGDVHPTAAGQVVVASAVEAGLARARLA